MNNITAPVEDAGIRTFVSDEKTEAGTFFIAYSLSDHRKVLPDGSLLCLGVPIASLEPMTYRGVEVVPLMQKYGLAPMQQITAVREEGDLFNEVTIASLNTAPITLGHPATDDVIPANYQQNSRGSATNIRRGEGEKSSFLMADLVVRDAEAIAAIADGKAGYISIGYSAQWVPVNETTFRQVDIIGNHIALVDNPRGGPSLKIGDRKPMTPTLTRKDRRRGFVERALSYLKSNNSTAGMQELQKLQDELDGDDAPASVTVNINGAERAAEPIPPVIPQQDEASPEAVARQAGEAAAAKTEMKAEQFEQIISLLQALVGKQGASAPAIDESAPLELTEAPEITSSDDDMPDDVDMSDIADEAVEEGVVEEKDRDKISTKDSALTTVGGIIRHTAASAVLIDNKINLSSITDSAGTIKSALRNLHMLRCRVIDAAKLRPYLSSVFRDNGYRSFTTNKLGFREAGRLARMAISAQIALNNKSAVHDSISGHVLVDNQTKTPSQLNKLFREHYSRGGQA
ncbi:DUF2213 domain-containing protein [Entomobacter blattae]|uniref:DUF2213 domain-containing protein n=1 Tax=Entomobacter blattae TaxID=2762277 RepID=A0A7H1NU01_9PROT|nr:DUF2213 domain-containing protein [Entomobacter blattae]QNT79261.1 hypothetical protein JGUZn3_20560 [Entomobacter blattae]